MKYGVKKTPCSSFTPHKTINSSLNHLFYSYHFAFGSSSFDDWCLFETNPEKNIKDEQVCCFGHAEKINCSIIFHS